MFLCSYCIKKAGSFFVGEYGKALVFYKRSEKIEPSNERTLILHANNLLNLHQYEKAAEIIIRYVSQGVE